MRLRAGGIVAAALAVSGFVSGTAEACQRCQRTPCAYAPAPPPPAVQCVTEMVPYTVYRQRTRIDYHPVTETVMVPEPQTTWVERPRVVCKPVFDTTYVQRTVNFCRPVVETSMVDQLVTVCKPVSTTQQVTEYCMQPRTEYVTVAARQKCGLCGKVKPACGCQTVARTSYTPVPVVRDVVLTRYVPEVQSRQVPRTSVRMVPETKVENVPITHCRIVREVVNERVPVTTVRCVPKTVTRQVPVPVCETVAETCYRPVTRMVPVAPAGYGYAPAAAPQAAPSGQQAAPSKQG